MNFKSLLLIFLALSNTALGDNLHETAIFSCMPEGKKKVSISQKGDTITYTYGRVGDSPELRISRPKSDLRISLEDTSGRSISSSVSFTSGEYTYTVYSSIDRISDYQDPKSGVLIKRRNSYLSNITCIQGSENGSLLDLYEK